MTIRLISLVIIIMLSGFYISAQNTMPKREFRAVWVTTVNHLDWPSTSGLSTAEQKKEFKKLVARHKANGMNALIVQVRAASDAFYDSKYEPWSQWLTGKQGLAPEPYYDPLDFMIKECHDQNMELHAWFNLFRGVSHLRFSDVADNHVTRKHKDWFYQYNESLFFDPGIPEVRDYLIKIIKDVAKRYDVDGIHLDDYFYPQEYRGKNRDIDDRSTYRKYGDDWKNIEDWRRNNIDLLVKGIYDSIKAEKSYVKFGISPFPVWRHKYDHPEGSETDRTQTAFNGYYADTRKWIQEGWVDYMAPQLYWGTEHKKANFNNLMTWWSENSFERHIYIGHAAYRLEEVSENSWKDPAEIGKQLQLCRNNPFIKGSVFFRSKSFEKNPLNIEDSLRKEYYRYPALIPTMSWIDSIPPEPVRDLKAFATKDGISISWSKPQKAADGDTAKYYCIYRFRQSSPMNLGDPKNILALTENTIFTDYTMYPDINYYYVITSLDKLHNESMSFTGINAMFDGVLMKEEE